MFPSASTILFGFLIDFQIDGYIGTFLCNSIIDKLACIVDWNVKIKISLRTKYLGTILLKHLHKTYANILDLYNFYNS